MPSSIHPTTPLSRYVSIQRSTLLSCTSTTTVPCFLQNRLAISLTHFIERPRWNTPPSQDGGLVSRSAKRLSSNMEGASGRNPQAKREPHSLSSFLFPPLDLVGNTYSMYYNGMD